jgi:hypothetical protein
MKYLLLLSILLSFLSCSNLKERDNSQLDYAILKSNEIPIDANVQYEHSQIQLVDEDTFVGLDQNFSKLDFFSLAENEFLFSTQFENDGPNRIYPVSSFFYHNKDSIFLFSLAASSFQLINHKAEVKALYRMDDNRFPATVSKEIKGNEGQFFPIAITENGEFHFPFIYDAKANELLVNIVADSYFEGFNDRQTIYSGPIISNFDLETQEFTQFQGKWPSRIYHQKMVPSNPFTNFCLNSDNQDVLINFYNANQIFSVKEDEFFKVESNHAKGDITLFDIENQKEYSTEEELDALNDDEAYVNLIYDPYQNLYYRIFKFSNNQDESGTHKMEANWSLIAFTPAFKVLGEVEFPASVYNFLQMIPTEKGLLISKESAWSKKNKEEIYEFDLVKINF